MDNIFVFLLNDLIWFLGLYTYANTLRIDYTFGIIAGLNFIYFFIDDIAKFLLNNFLGE